MKNAVLLSAALALAPGTPARSPQESAAPEVGLRCVQEWIVPEGKEGQARDLALRMSRYFQANHGQEIPSAVFKRDEGQRIVWFLDLPDIASFDRLQGTLNGEEGWRALSEELDRAFDVEVAFMLPASETRPARDGARAMRWSLRLRASYGNYAGALRHARAVAEYVNSHCQDTWVEVYREVLPDNGSIQVYSDWKSPDAWRRAQLQLWQEEEFLRLMEGAAGLYEDELWEEGPLDSM